MKDEFALLAECTRASPATAQSGSVSANSLDWGLVLRLAKRHRVEGHLAACLLSGKVTGGPTPPSSVTEELRAEKQAIALAEMRMLSSFKMIQEHLDTAGIAFVLLKGLQITSRGYGRLGVRSNHDIDLLVDEENVFEAVKCLEALGFNDQLDVNVVAENINNLTRERKDL